MIAVLDTSVVVAGIFFRADSYRCLVAFARRQYQLAMTNDIQFLRRLREREKANHRQRRRGR